MLDHFSELLMGCLYPIVRIINDGDWKAIVVPGEHMSVFTTPFLTFHTAI